MLLRGDPDASPTPGKVQAQHINTCVPPPPVACPQLPPSPRLPWFLHQRFLHRCALLFQLPHPRAPQGFFNNDFFIVASSLDVQSPCWCGRPSDSGGRHVKGEHVKEAANAAFQGAGKKGMLRRAATRT